MNPAPALTPAKQRGALSTMSKMAVVMFAATVFAQTFLDVLFSAGRIGGDFAVRYNEVECLKSGVNPFDVWSGRIRHETYYSFHGSPQPGQTKMVHAYPPWEYTFFLPLSFLSLRAASGVFFLIQVLSLAITARFLFSLGQRLRESAFDGLFVASCGLFLGGAIQNAFWFRQFGVINLAAFVLMFAALNRNRPIAAGLCWGFLMVKPQVGLPLLIPLVLGRQFVTIGTAVVVCCAAAIPPSLYCGQSPIDMILSLQESAGGVLHSTAILPGPAFGFLARTVHPAFPGLGSAIVAWGLCIWLSWRLRRTSSWFVRFLPAILCSTAWTYLQLHDKTLFLFLQAAAAVCIILEHSRLHRLALALPILFSACSLGVYFHAKTVAWTHELGLSVPPGTASQLLYATYVVGSFVQYVLFCAFLYWLSGPRKHLAAFAERKESTE